MSTSQPQVFTRTSGTWLMYGQLAYFAYLQSIWGPLMPLVREDLNLSYTQGAFHATAFALGMVIAGATADRLAERMSGRFIFWAGGGGMAIGAFLLVIAVNLSMTIMSTVFMGLFGTLLLIMIQSGLTEAHSRFRATAITEANVAAAIGISIAPLFVGSAEYFNIGWRSAALIPILAWIIMFQLRANKDFLNRSSDKQIKTDQALSSHFWMAWIVLVLGVAAEWSIALWSADYLLRVTELPPSLSAMSVAILGIAIVVGRLIGSRLTKRYSTMRLLMISLLCALTGSIIFLNAAQLPWLYLGLSLMGMGIANVYPLGVSIAFELSPNAINKASARASLGAAVAILLAPQTLGILADTTSITQSYSIIPILISSALLMAIIVNARTH